MVAVRSSWFRLTMSRKITCSSCNANYTIADGFKASRVACKKCGATMQLVDEPQVADAEPPQAAKPAAAPRTRAPSGTVTAPKTLSKRERLGLKGKPAYTSPMFYVCAVAAVVCIYFAATFH